MSDETTPASTTNAILTILHNKADAEFKAKLEAVGELFNQAVSGLSLPHMVFLDKKTSASQAIWSIKELMFNAYQQQYRDRYVRRWMDRNMEALSTLREFESQQS